MHQPRATQHSLYSGEDWMKKFCTALTSHVVNVINFEKKKMLPITEKNLKSQQNATEWYLCRKIPHKNLLKIKITKKLETIVILHIVFVI